MIIEWNPETIAVSIAHGNRIVRTIVVPTIDDLLLNIEDGEEAIEGLYDPAEYYLVEGEPEPVLIPSRPEGDGWQFDHDLGEWTDPRTPADLAAELQAKRDAAHIAKSDLLIALNEYQLLPPEQIRQAKDGQIPDSLLPMMADMPEDAQLYAEIKWATDAEISRVDPVILAAAYALGLSDTLVDAIFGVSP